MAERIELIPKGFVAIETMRRDDKTVFEQTFTDQNGREYMAKFLVRNSFIGLINRALRRLMPIARS
jgi:hypothetical protein